MTEKLSDFITYFEIAAFATSLLAWRQLRQTTYLKVFPFLLFIVVMVEVPHTFFREWFSYFTTSVYNLQVPLQHLLYLFILYLSFEKPKNRKTTLILMFSMTIIVTIAILLFSEKNRINSLAYCTGAVIVIGVTLMKFYEMLQYPSTYNFLKNPFFYMLFAYLLFNVGTLPYFTMGNWLYYTLKRHDILAVLISVMTIFNCLLYLTYTAVFVWMINTKQSS